MGGWVKNHRKIKEWGWYKKPLTAHLFQHLIREACHKQRNVYGQSVGRGQLLTGRKSLAESTGLSEQEVRTALKHLKSTNDITIKSTSKYSIITVCNYDEYQAKDEEVQPSNQPAHQPSSNQVPTTYKKERRKEERKQQTKPFNVTPSVAESAIDDLF